MYVPAITTRATNVELTDERRAMIIKCLQPLGELFAPGQEPEIDVVLRKIPNSLVRGKYCVSARLQAGGQSYVSMEIDTSLKRVLRKVERSLRRTASGSKRIQVAAKSSEPNFMRYLKYSF